MRCVVTNLRGYAILSFMLSWLRALALRVAYGLCLGLCVGFLAVSKSWFVCHEFAAPMKAALLVGFAIVAVRAFVEFLARLYRDRGTTSGRETDNVL